MLVSVPVDSSRRPRDAIDWRETKKMATQPTETATVPVMEEEDIQIIKIKIVTPAKDELKINVRLLSYYIEYYGS